MKRKAEGKLKLGICSQSIGETERYLNPAGAEVKGLEETATGIYYSGTTIASVNKIYAGDNSWSNRIYEYMQHFYDNISK